MSTFEPTNKVLYFPKTEAKKPSSTERIWGKEVVARGCTGIPSIIIQAQSRLGITPLQMNILIQSLDYWHEPERKPFPTKRNIADRIGVTEKTIQNNIRQLEKASLIRREYRRTSSGDWNSNIYHLDGLAERVRKMEPDFREAKEKQRAARRLAETPIGRRGGAA
jgi:predicted transcriptional regulator